MSFSEFGVETARRRIPSSGQRRTDSRMSDGTSWRKSVIDRPWNPHSERITTQTRRWTLGQIHASGRTNDPTSFTRAMCRNTFFPKVVLQNKDTLVIFELTRAHYFPDNSRTPLHNKGNLFFVQGKLISLLKATGVSDDVAQELQMPIGPQAVSDVAGTNAISPCHSQRSWRFRSKIVVEHHNLTHTGCAASIWAPKFRTPFFTVFQAPRNSRMNKGKPEIWVKNINFPRRSRRRWVCRRRQRSAGYGGCARTATWRRATSGDHVVRRLVCVVCPLHFVWYLSNCACFVRDLCVCSVGLMIKSGACSCQDADQRLDSC